jgi:chromosomal replication initiation ATPase DnaA
MGYRARVEPPTPDAYSEIFKRQAYTRGIRYEQPVLDHVLANYRTEQRQMKGCEPRDLLDRATDICLFEGRPLELTCAVVDIAWRNYFGTSHTFEPAPPKRMRSERNSADPLEL